MYILLKEIWTKTAGGGKELFHFQLMYSCEKRLPLIEYAVKRLQKLNSIGSIIKKRINQSEVRLWVDDTNENYAVKTVKDISKAPPIVEKSDVSDN